MTDSTTTLPDKLVVFAHGKESGPWGTKITRLAGTARGRGFEVISPDYSHSPDPRARVAQLLELAPRARSALVLVGSSMGGFVSAFASPALRPQALMLIAPAFYFPGYDEEPPPPPPINAVVHGWSDEVVPVDRALRYARQHRASLHLLDGGHTLTERLPELERIFDALLLEAETLGLYRLARYVVEVASGTIELGVERVDAEVDARLAGEAGVARHWALVTACNPLGVALAPDENAARHAQLCARLAADGIRSLEARGEDPSGDWPAEQSRLLIDPPPGYAETLGRAFAQNALLRGALGAASEIVWLR